ncbi:hypothetical protein [Halorussus ruber]|nr:hypothetical protein [Halorussus ruber]
MEDDSADETEWTRRSLLEMGTDPTIREAVLPYPDKEPGNLTKKA